MDSMRGEITKREQKVVDKFLKPKSIQRGRKTSGVLSAIKMTWYLDGWISKIIFVYGGVALLITIIYLLAWLF